MRARVEPRYRPSGAQGEIVLYTGDVTVTEASEERVVKGQLELRLAARPGFVAHFAGSHPDVWSLASENERTVAIPAGADLKPPGNGRQTKEPDGAPWVEEQITVNGLEAGEIARAQRFVFHVSGAMDAHFPTAPVPDGRQAQLGFRLPGWDLVMAPVNEPRGEHDFAFVVEATPEAAATAAGVEELARRLFVLLSFVTSREVGVAPVCGLTEAGDITWASWGAPRLRLGTPGVRWCPRLLVAGALPAIAHGFADIATNSGMEAVVDLAINHLLAADGSEALDVRVPIACAGLEMLGWATLQHHGGVDADVLRRMNAASVTRRLLHWAGVPTTIPDAFDSLAARRDDRQQGGGPEVLFGVRNRLMHPPKNISSPKWPAATELRESWQLATWYLEMVILRLLGYNGQYWCRLRLGRQGADVEHVPWAVRAADDE